MTSIARHLSLGFMALIAAAVMVGCTSSDAGDTLTIDFDGPSGMTITSSVSGGVTTFSGKTSVVAKVKYRGKKSLVYLWSYSMPVKSTATVDKDSLTITTSTTAPLVTGSAGTGTATLNVYESAGTLDVKASTTIEVFVAGPG
jgi:hypothetical protein